MKKIFIILSGILVVVLIGIVVVFKFVIGDDFLKFSDNDNVYLGSDDGVVEVYDRADLSSVVMSLPRGYKVEGNFIDGFFQFKVDSNVYYVPKEFTFDKKSDAVNYKVGYINGFSNVYSDYGTIVNDVVGTIESGAKVKVISSTTVDEQEWVEIEFDGKSGYVIGYNVVLEESMVVPGSVNGSVMLDYNLKKGVSSSTHAVYLNFDALMSPTLFGDLNSLPNLKTIYVDYKSEDYTFTSIESPTLEIEQNILMTRKEFLPIIEELSKKYKVIGEVSVGLDSVLPGSIEFNGKNYLDFSITDNWIYFVDLIKDMSGMGFDEVVLSNYYFPSEITLSEELDKVILLQEMSQYIIDMVWNENINVSVKTDYITSTTSDVVNSVQINELAGKFDRVYIEALLNNLPENTFGQLYPWNNPDLTAGEWASKVQELNQSTIGESEYVIIAQAYNSPVYPVLLYTQKEITNLITPFSNRLNVGGYVLYNEPDDPLSYEHLRMFLND